MTPIMQINRYSQPPLSFLRSFRSLELQRASNPGEKTMKATSGCMCYEVDGAGELVHEVHRLLRLFYTAITSSCALPPSTYDS